MAHSNTTPHRFSLRMLLGVISYLALVFGLLINAGKPGVVPLVDTLYVLLLFTGVVLGVGDRKSTPFAFAYVGVALIHRLSKDTPYDGAWQFLFQGIGEMSGTGVSCYFVGWNIAGVTLGICGGFIAHHLTGRTVAK